MQQLCLPQTAWAWQVMSFIEVATDVAVIHFFVASGYLLAGHVGERAWWGRETWKRVRSLLVPFFAWGVIYGLATVVVAAISGLLGGPRPIPWPHGREWFVFFGVNPWVPPNYAILWFLRTLFLFVLLAPMLFYPLRRGRWHAWCWVLVLWVMLAFFMMTHASVGCDLASPFGRISLLSLRGMAAFVLGAALRLHPLPRRCPVWGHWLAFTLGIACALVAIVAYREGLVWGTLGHWGAVTFLLLGVWGCIPARAWPRWLTAQAFPIYLTHFLFYPVFANFLFCLTAPIPDGLPTCIASLLFMFLSSLTCAVLLRRFSPRLAAVLFGGR